LNSENRRGLGLTMLVESRRKREDKVFWKRVGDTEPVGTEEEGEGGKAHFCPRKKLSRGRKVGGPLTYEKLGNQWDGEKLREAMDRSVRAEVQRRDHTMIKKVRGGSDISYHPGKKMSS